MTNLKEGQRIDVYEVVDCIEIDDCGTHFFNIGDHICASIMLLKAGNDTFHYKAFDSTYLFKEEVKLIGTFIVKSLKGVSNA